MIQCHEIHKLHMGNLVMPWEPYKRKSNENHSKTCPGYISPQNQSTKNKIYFTQRKRDILLKHLN